MGSLVNAASDRGQKVEYVMRDRNDHHCELICIDENAW